MEQKEREQKEKEKEQEKERRGLVVARRGGISREV